MTRLRLQLHPAAQVEQPLIGTIHPDSKEMQQSVTVNLSPGHNRLCVIPMLPDFLQDRQYSLWTMIDRQPLKPSPLQLADQLPQERMFEVVLHPGVNVIETHVIAATPRGERTAGGPETELEVFIANVNVLRS